MYVIERVPTKYIASNPEHEDLWYCHMKGYDYIPVFGSIGSRQKAAAVCRQRNPDGKVHYA